jgi:hypothetical protein
VVALHRWSESGHRLALVNFGDETDVALADALAPVAPPGDWRVRWHSNARRYGGDDVLPVVSGGSVRLPAWSAVLLALVPGRSRTG